MILDQVVLVVAACALLSGALRVGARITTIPSRPTARRGSTTEWVLVAASLAAAFVVCWTLVLGLVGLAGSVVALAVGPLLAWAVTRCLLRGPSPSLTAELADRWDRASRRERTVAFALAGAAAGCMVSVAVHPTFEVDAVSYHLADVVGWLHSGHAGSVQTFSYDYPVGYYPVTNEVLLTWLLGVSRSFAPLAVWPTVALALALLALWRLLELHRVPRAAAALAVVAFAALPMVVVSVNVYAADTDLPAVTWLACTAALSAGAVAQPALLGPALIAAGLAVGTKTTVAPLVVAALVAGMWRSRAALRVSRWWLAGGAVVGLLVGAPWYVRATAAHGWPLWPFSSGPTGDPIPHVLTLFHRSFLSHPVASVSANPHAYLKGIAGGLGLIAGAFAVPALARSRAALLTAAAAVGSLLVWAASPYTGIASNPLLAALPLTTVRYMMGSLGACAAALAIAARDAPPRRRLIALAVLASATAGSLVADFAIGSVYITQHLYLLGAAAAGAAAAWIASRTRVSVPHAPFRAVAAVLAVVLLAVSAPGWLRRESRDKSFGDPVLAFMLRQPDFASGSRPISFAPAVVATLAGPRLRHPILLIPATEPCDRVRARLSRSWVVVRPKDYTPGITHAFDAARCLERAAPAYNDGDTVAYAPLTSG